MMTFDRRVLAPTLLAATLALGAALPAAIAASELPTVSPGEIGRVVEIEARCPTFSWAATSAVSGSELVLYRLATDEATASTEPPQQILRRTFRAGVGSWTPALDSCLERNAVYAWTVRTPGDESAAEQAGEGSEPRLFRVSSLPTVEEVDRALEVLRGYRQAQATGDGGFAAPRSQQRAAVRGIADAATVRAAGTDSPLGGPPSIAIRGETSSTIDGSAGLSGHASGTSGATSGVIGQTDSPVGVGVRAANVAGGIDLLLDGPTPAELTESGVDRASGSPKTFGFGNSGGGGMTLEVDGVEVVTTATDQDTLGALACVDGQIAKLVAGAWVCSADGVGNTYLAGNQLQLTGSTFNVLEGANSGLDADLLDGLNSAQFAPTSHSHPGEAITSGTVADARIAGTLTRDAEVFGIVTSNDGAGSGLDADFLDGLSSSDFQTTGAFRSYTGVNVPIETAFPTYTEVSSVTLGAGSWIVVVNTGLRLSDTFDGTFKHKSNLFCELNIGGTTTESKDIGPPSVVNAYGGYLVFESTHLTLLGAKYLAAPSTAVVQCAAADVAGDSVAIVGTWIAIRVGSLQGL
ncbi:MAG: hypothetical protein ABI689_00850 [Thermoanaerobaculia bacterium]